MTDRQVADPTGPSASPEGPPGPARLLASAWGAGGCGVLAAAAGLTVAQVGAALLGPGSSPVVALADQVIARAPAPLRERAIDVLGTADKPVLVTAVLAVTFLLAGVLGVAGRRRPRLIRPGALVLAVAGGGAVLAGPHARFTDVIPTLVGAVVAGASLEALTARLPLPVAPGCRGPGDPGPGDTADPGPGDTADPGPGDTADPGLPGSAGPGLGGAVDPRGPADEGTALADGTPRQPAGSRGFTWPDRRGFLKAAGGTGVVVVLAGIGARFLDRRRAAAAASRAGITIPPPRSTAPPIPAGADLGVPDVAPLTTPAADFYRIDTALVVPALRAEDWTLRVHGMVDRELTLTYADLLARPLIERDITLNCVSNEVGGDLISSGRWIGAPLAPLLAEARIRSGADQVVSRSSDGFTAGTPVQTVLDGRDAMLAVALNGEPLPLEHGFPVRMLVPGLYGYVSATKWLTELELTTFAAYDAFWIKRGWARKAPVKTASRIDTPHDGSEFPAGPVVVAGVAWAQHRGIDKVEVRVDDGAWQAAELATAIGPDTWVQWRWRWDAAPGTHVVQVRATDGLGRTQTGEMRPPVPDGATGWHWIHLTAR